MQVPVRPESPNIRQDVVKPMLAAKVEVSQLNRLDYPMYGQIKYDGIRAINDYGLPMSRSMKVIPNERVRALFRIMNTRNPFTHGWDGELIVGEPTDQAVCMNTTSGVMSRDGNPQVRFYLFDNWADGHLQYRDRRMKLVAEYDMLAPEEKAWIVLCDDYTIQGPVDAEEMAAKFMGEGHEGMMLRSPLQTYKFGRSTMRQQHLLKMKAFEDAEGEVIGSVELTRNGNEAFKNELGYTARSSHKANQVAGNTLGALVVRSPRWKGDFNIGTGFDAATRQALWEDREGLVGRIVKFKYLASGMKELPRHPVFLGWRHPDDIS